jgi:hypothetical protein
MPKPFNTVPGLAPPPIPVPPGVTPPPPGAPQSHMPPAPTMLGMAAAKKPSVPSVVPQIKKPNGPPGAIPSIAKPPSPPIPTAPPAPGKLTMGWDAMPEPPPDAAPTDGVIEEPSGLIEVDDSGPVKVPHRPMTDDEDIGTVPYRDPSGNMGLGPSETPTVPVAPFRMPRPTPGQSFDSTTGEMSRSMIESLNRKAQLQTSEMMPVRPSAPEITIEAGTSPGLAAAPPGPLDLGDDAAASDFAAEAAAVANDLPEPSPSSTMPGHTPARYDSQPGGGYPGASAPAMSAPTVSPPPAAHAPMATPPAKTKSKVPMVLLAVLLLGGLGAGGYYVYTTQLANKDTDVAVGPGSSKTGSAQVKTATADAAAAKVESADAAIVATATPDAAAAVATPDAATQVATATPDAGTTGDTPNVVKPSGSSDQLQITSAPAGARVFIDGSDQGTAPVKLPGSSDRHSLAVVAIGYDLYLAEVDGHGVFNVELKAIEKGKKAFGGIKVLKCKKDRYYVYVDGKPTGQLCPTERINVVTGPHEVEIYDLVTETRRKFNINVKDEGASERIRLE